MTSNESTVENQTLNIKCKKLLDEDKIRFAGIIDEKGELLAGGFKKGISHLMSDGQKLSEFMALSFKYSGSREFDEDLGPLNYVASRRDRLVLLCFPLPLSHNVLLVSAEPEVNVEEIASKVVKIYSGDAQLPLKSE